MQYINYYKSPIGNIMLASDSEYLTGLWFDGKKTCTDTINEDVQKEKLPVFEETRRWLDVYFSGKNPGRIPEIRVTGSEFRCNVWGILRQLSYGQTITYGEIAKRIAEQMGVPRMSAQAVGGAVGHNPIAIIIPCHRVVGADGSLTGYAGGIDKKQALLRLEGVSMDDFFVPLR